MPKRVIAALMFSLAFSHPAHAQLPADDPFAEASVRLGIVALQPRISITNVGIDTNVFNTSQNPQRDFTTTLNPGTQLWMRTGRGLLTFDGNLELVYFNRFDSERSVNSRALAQYEWRFNRMRPYFSAVTLNTKERPGFEIDARARRYETQFNLGNDLRTGSKGVIRIDLQHRRYAFAGDEVFAGRPLNQRLNRTLNGIGVSWRQRLTVLTTWVTRVTRESERFEFEDARNADSFRIASGFELGRFALIRGSAFVGYRRLTPAAGGDLPQFSGLTADIDVSYTAPTQTRLSLAVDREVQYSYDVFPYYVQTSWTATLTQRVIGRWDVQLNGGRDRLSYRSVEPTDARSFVGRFGGGVGYALNDQVRAGFDIQSLYRRSDIPGREYGGIRAGVSVTYGY